MTRTVPAGEGMRRMQFPPKSFRRQVRVGIDRTPPITAAILLMAVVAGSRACRADEFGGGIRPILKEYCLGCHSTQKQKGDLDLEVFSTLQVVKKHPGVWQKVIEQLGD